MTYRTLAAAAVAASVFAPPAAQAFQSETYRTLVTETVLALESGDYDIAHLIGVQEQLIDLAVEGARAYGARNPQHGRMMTFVADEVPAMRAMSLDQLEEDWHEGGALSRIGLDLSSLDLSGAAYAHMDTIVDPVTAYIALKQYRDTGDEEYLELAAEELAEVLDQVEILE